MVVSDKGILNSIRDVHHYADMLSEAQVAIITCGDINVELTKIIGL